MYMEMFVEAYEKYTKEYGNDFNRCIVNPDIYKGLKEECDIPYNLNLNLLDIKIDYGLGTELFYFYKHENNSTAVNYIPPLYIETDNSFASFPNGMRQVNTYGRIQFDDTTRPSSEQVTTARRGLITSNSIIGDARVDLNNDVYFNVDRQTIPREYYISGGSISSDSIRDNSISNSRFSNGLSGYMTTDEIDFTKE